MSAAMLARWRGRCIDDVAGLERKYVENAVRVWLAWVENCNQAEVAGLAEQEPAGPPAALSARAGVAADVGVVVHVMFPGSGEVLCKLNRPEGQRALKAETRLFACWAAASSSGKRCCWGCWKDLNSEARVFLAKERPLFLPLRAS